jgi:16S rRNA (guanine(966)-N(2))-methyltransferase RsmD
MRIVGGDLGGRRFDPPPRIPARPTTDRAREGLFNILSNLIDLEGIRVLDIFAGTGGVSYEMISRGAASVTAVEGDAITCAFIQKTAAAFGIKDKLQLVKGDVFRFLKSVSAPYDLVFADPPYALPQMKDLPDMLLVPSLLASGGLVIVEHSSRTDFAPHSQCFRTATYGDSAFSFFKAS